MTDDRNYGGKHYVIYSPGYGFLTALRDWQQDVLLAKRFKTFELAKESKVKLTIVARMNAIIMLATFNVTCEGTDE